MLENNELPKNEAHGLSAIIGEMQAELRQFVETRVQMLKSELQEKLGTLKVAAPLVVVAIILLGTAYVLFTLALVGLISVAFSYTAYRWCFAFLIVGGLWSLLGAVAGYFARREFRSKSLAPRKTLEILKEDKIWLQKEVRNQI